jgi:hypothetical protein
LVLAQEDFLVMVERVVKVTVGQHWLIQAAVAVAHKTMQQAALVVQVTH